MALLERLKIRLEIQSDKENVLLSEMLESARSLYLSLRYPFSDYPDMLPVLTRRGEDWIIRAATEMYSRVGADGQSSHNENGISRSWDTGTVSNALMNEVVPVVGVFHNADA